MACHDKMSHLETLNSFFCERLMAVAAEIFQAVKDTLSEYQDEIERSRQEVVYLRKMLTEVSISHGAVAQTDGVSLEQPLDSVIQVKLEINDAEQDLEQPLTQASTLCVPADAAKTRELQHKTTVVEQEEIGVCLDSVVTVKLEQCTEEFSSAVQTESACSEFGNTIDEQGPHPSSQCDFSYMQNATTENISHYKTCGRSLRDGRLKTHVVVHPKTRTYRCDLCGKCYSTSYALKLHLRTHTGERPFTCKFCVKTFNQKAHVKEHERIHTGEKPYSCSACGKRFNRTYQVKVHIRNYHPDEMATIIKSRPRMSDVCAD